MKTLGVVKKECDILGFFFQCKFLEFYEKLEIITIEDARHAVQLEQESHRKASVDDRN